jgi:serpin B
MIKTFVFLFLLISACTSNKKMKDNNPIEQKETVESERIIAGTKDINRQIEENNSFAFELLPLVFMKGENLIISPFSISNAMAMVYAGARNTTESEIASVMHFGENTKEFHSVFYVVNDHINKLGSDDIAISLVNGLWVQKDYQFLPSYLALCDNYYGSALYSTDFINESEKSRRNINTWVEENTANRIIELFQPGIINSLTRFVITNAIYMKAKWAVPFDPNLSRKNIFTNADGTKKETMFMNQFGTQFLYSENDTFQCVSLPYKNNKLHMLIFLPRSQHGIENFIGIISMDKFRYWKNKLNQKRIQQLSVPVFNYFSYFDLNDYLRKMGVSEAFSDAADFSGITGKKNLKISKVVHKAFIEVNEEGTEAAAATGVIGMEKSSMPERDPVRFIANQPFFFLIADAAMDNILFMGVLNDPK